jgi:hypothetical protein
MKKTICFAFILCLVAFAGLISFRAIVIHKADEKTRQLMSQTDESIPPALQATQAIYKNFSKNGYERHKILARLRPYLSNDRLPDFMRIPPGAIELVTNEGWCDDAARALIYTLENYGMTAHQWNMQSPRRAHSAVVANLPSPALLDPFYGYHSLSNGKPGDPLQIQKQMKGGQPLAASGLTPLDEKSNHEFYKDFGMMFMGAQGTPLTITAQIPVTDKPLELGAADGNYADARTAIMRNNMTMTWEYTGHKYDRAWTRELVAQQPLQLDIILTKAPDNGVIRTFSPAPTVDGTKLSWNLLKGEKIISEDAKAAISWTRLNSYIDVDQIVITPKGDTP